jgi:hypothetical protein
MDYTKILAAKLNLPIDNNKITEEILACQHAWIYMPAKKQQLDRGLDSSWFLSSSKEDYQNSDYIINAGTSDREIVTRNLKGPYIFYLTDHPDLKVSGSYEKSKLYNLEGWIWNPELVDKLSYTKSLIENFFEQVGCIRVFVMPDTFLVTHQDYNFNAPINEVSTDYAQCVGLSLIPSDGMVPMKIWSRKLNRVVDVPGNAMIFNDSVRHGVPKTTGIRITIRIFGKIDYNQFNQYIDNEHCYYI